MIAPPVTRVRVAPLVVISALALAAAVFAWRADAGGAGELRDRALAVARVNARAAAAMTAMQLDELARLQRELLAIDARISAALAQAEGCHLLGDTERTEIQRRLAAARRQRAELRRRAAATRRAERARCVCIAPACLRSAVC